MIHNNKVYANADEKFVKATIVYKYGSSLYYDTDYAKPVLTTELVDLFLNGFVVYDAPNAAYKIPVSCTASTVVCLGGADAKPAVYSATVPTEE